MSPTSMVSSILLSLPSTVSSTTNLHILNVVGDVESMNNFHINHHHYSKSRFRKFQLMWYILMSAPFLVFPSNLATAYHIFAKKNSNDVMHPDVSDLPGLPLLVVLAVPSAVDHQITWAKIRQVGYLRKRLLMNIIVLQSICLWVGYGWKEPNLQNPPFAAFYHFGASWKDVIARSLTFDR